jgi:hypothetical protein
MLLLEDGAVSSVLLLLLLLEDGAGEDDGDGGTDGHGEDVRDGVDVDGDVDGGGEDFCRWRISVWYIESLRPSVSEENDGSVNICAAYFRSLKFVKGKAHYDAPLSIKTQGIKIHLHMYECILRLLVLRV